MTLAALPQRGAPLVAADDVGATLREIRVAAGLSQARLIAAIREAQPRLPGVDAAALAHWEHNRRVPGLSQLHALLTACNATDEQVWALVERLSVRSLNYEVLFLRWSQANLTPAEARESWNTLAPLVPTHPRRRA